jgi:hypothetical protein
MCVLNRKLKSRYGARKRFQEPSLELRSQAIDRLAGRYDNPMPIWFPATIAGLKLPTLTKISRSCLINKLYVHYIAK